MLKEQKEASFEEAREQEESSDFARSKRSLASLNSVKVSLDKRMDEIIRLTDSQEREVATDSQLLDSVQSEVANFQQLPIELAEDGINLSSDSSASHTIYHNDCQSFETGEEIQKSHQNAIENHETDNLTSEEASPRPQEPLNDLNGGDTE